MSDERTFVTAQAETERQRDLAIEHSRNDVKTYSVIVLGRNDDQPFTITAINREERAEKMSEAGISLHSDNWAAGYIDINRQLQIAYNNDEARRLVAEHLRRR